MTKEDLLKALKILVENNKDSEATAYLIWDLWMNHPSYTIVAGKVVHKETGVELGK